MAGALGHEALPWAELAAAVSPPVWAQEVATPLHPLQESVSYLRGADGAVLVDPSSGVPLQDDWWNWFVGVQAGAIRTLDGLLRGAGVPQAFGWTIITYTLFIKVLLTPLQEASKRSMGMLSLLSPEAERVKEKFKDQPREVQEEIVTRLYTDMDVSPVGGCLPVLLTFPVYISLFSVWRRLYAEGFPYFGEGWGWVPSLAYPNPDFKFSFDWLFEFTAAGDPTIGWQAFGLYLVLPALLIGNSLANAVKADSNPAAKKQTGWTRWLPWFGVALIVVISFELPQAMLLYYAANIFFSAAQDEYLNWRLRKEIPGFEQFQKTGKFPEGAFEEMRWSLAPAAKSLHEAAQRGDLKGIERLLEASGDAGGAAALVDAVDERGLTALSWAVASGQLRATELLLERGSFIGVVDGEKNSLLHHAAGFGHEEVLRKLLAIGGDDTWPGAEWQQLRNAQGQSVVDVAAVGRHTGVLELLAAEFGVGEARQAQQAVLEEAQRAQREQLQAQLAALEKLMAMQAKQAAAAAQAPVAGGAAEVAGAAEGAAAPELVDACGKPAARSARALD